MDGSSNQDNFSKSEALRCVSLENLMRMISKRMITPEDIYKYDLLCSVTEKANKVKSPARFLKPSTFEKIQLAGGGIETLFPAENVSPALIGLAVEYLTRYQTGSPLPACFKIARLGATEIGEDSLLATLLDQIHGLDDQSITSAIRASGFDCAYRAGASAYRPVEDIYPDEGTVENIRTMVNRSLAFFDEYGPKVMDGLTFPGGYTGHIASGDGDFMTSDTLWDFKVSKKRLLGSHVLQLLIYWRLGVHSIYPEYQEILYLGVYNPRMNIVYRYPIAQIPSETIETVDHDIICYPPESQTK